MKSSIKIKNFIPVALVMVVLLIAFPCTTGCDGDKTDKKGESGLQTFEVKRGNILETVSSDGNLIMPREFELRFGTAGTVEEVLVEEGDVVREGTLLARLDNSKQKIAIEKDLYALQKQINNLTGTTREIDPYPPSVDPYHDTYYRCNRKLDLPHRYANLTALYIFEKSQAEVDEAKDLLAEGYYKEAAIALRLSHHYMDISIELLNAPIPDIRSELDIMGTLLYEKEKLEPEEYEEMYPMTFRTIDLVDRAHEKLAKVESLMTEGDYAGASSQLTSVQQHLVETERAVHGTVGQLVRYNVAYPDTATSLDFVQLAKSLLLEIEENMNDGSYDTVQVATYLRTAQQELDIARTILQHNELVYEAGLNLTETQQYNLNLQKAMIVLYGHSVELMDTEILAPIDGTVVDVGVEIDDQLSAVDYSSITAVRLVDTDTVKFEGVIDEIDIYQVKLGQKANIIVDAAPDTPLTGTVSFISPFGTETADVLNFAVTIDLDPTDIELKGDMTATADIIIQDKKDVLLIPVQTIVTAPIGSLAAVLNEETGEPEMKRIVVGAQTYEYAEVVSGLEEGEKVLIMTEEVMAKLQSQRPSGPPGSSGGQRPPGAMQ
jgi:multidrug efflux pump subunit AcrA (membrane-fusion protein)